MEHYSAAKLRRLLNKVIQISNEGLVDLDKGFVDDVEELLFALKEGECEIDDVASELIEFLEEIHNEDIVVFDPELGNRYTVIEDDEIHKDLVYQGLLRMPQMNDSPYHIFINQGSGTLVYLEEVTIDNVRPYVYSC